MEKPPPNVRSVVTVLGDSLGIQLAQGLREAFQNKPDIFILSKARGSTGLVNTSERDWLKYTRELAASPEKNSVTLIMLGSNDAQTLRDETGAVHEPGSEKWLELYAKRVDEMIAPLKDKAVPVLWVGLPVSRSAKLSGSFLATNRIYRERVEKAGYRFVDIWDAFVDDHGRFSESGPDLSGDMVRLRAGDGVHFTKAGYRKLAFFVERDLTTLLAQPAERPEPGVMPEDLREQIRLQAAPRSPSLPSSADLRNAVPLPDVAALAPELRKREAGPIVLLTGPPMASVDTLSALEPPPKALLTPALKDAARLREEVFALGRAQYPKPNRGDDFGWPRR